MGGEALSTPPGALGTRQGLDFYICVWPGLLQQGTLVSGATSQVWSGHSLSQGLLPTGTDGGELVACARAV